MSLGAAFRSLLVADSDVSALVQGRIHPIEIPEGETPAFPAITYMQVSSVGARRLGGPTGFRSVRLQASCWAASYPVAHGLCEAVRRCLDGYTGTTAGLRILNIQADEGRDLDALEAGLFGVALDFIVKYHE